MKQHVNDEWENFMNQDDDSDDEDEDGEGII
jgi:hypothetical protein